MATNLQTEATHEVDVHEVEYLRHGDQALLARVYQPRGGGPFPAMLDVHGGAWVGGSRTSNEAIDSALAASGLVVAAIEFRQPPLASYPASMADTNYAVRWLKARAGDFNGQPGEVGALGSSSGGHMIALAALRPRDPRYAAIPLAEAPAIDATLTYVVVCWGIVDPLARYHMAQQKGRPELVKNHDAYWQSEAAMEEGSPTLILERGEAVTTPPMLLVQGTNDANVTPDMHDRFVAAYRRAGGSAQLEKYEGAVHTFITKDPTTAHSLAALAAIKAFIHQHTREMQGARR